MSTIEPLPMTWSSTDREKRTWAIGAIPAAEIRIRVRSDRVNDLKTHPWVHLVRSEAGEHERRVRSKEGYEPGCPEFDFATTSAARARMVFTQS